jgi:Prolipoprotein diacylglyceryltransferase
LIFIFLLWLTKRRKFEGQIIYTYMMIYSVVRFTIEFWRDDPRGSLLGLSTSQFIAILMFVFGLVMTLISRKRNATKDAAQRQDVAATRIQDSGARIQG